MGCQRPVHLRCVKQWEGSRLVPTHGHLERQQAIGFIRKHSREHVRRRMVGVIAFRIPSPSLLGKRYLHYLRLVGVGRGHLYPNAILFK